MGWKEGGVFALTAYKYPAVPAQGFQGGTRGTEGNTSISGWLMPRNPAYEQPDFRSFLRCGGNDGLSDTRKLVRLHLADESFRCLDLNRLEGGDGHRGPKKLKKICLFDAG